MYKIIVNIYDEKHFGSKLLIYKSEENYLIASKSRDGIFYSFLDNELKFLYPVDSYMRKINFSIDFGNIKPEISDCFDINLSEYRCSNCPDYIIRLIKK